LTLFEVNGKAIKDVPTMIDKVVVTPVSPHQSKEDLECSFETIRKYHLELPIEVVKPAVRFHQIEIIEFPTELGDNPSVCVRVCLLHVPFHISFIPFEEF